MKSIAIAGELSQGLLNRAAIFLKRIIFLPRSLFLKEVYWQGVAKGEGSGFSLAYIGEGESLLYLKDLYFDKVVEEKISKISFLSLWKEFVRLKDNGVCFFVEWDRLFGFLIPRGGFRISPWIRQKVFLKEKNYEEHARSIEDTYGRKARRYNYAFEITRDKDSVRKFYNELYLPYIKGRFQGLSHPRSLDDFLAVVNSGFLLEVMESKEPVAGVVCYETKEAITAFAFGLALDHERHLRRGALSAAYYFLFQWAQEHGKRIVDLLRSRPHALDGVFEHKRRWGACPCDDGWSHTSLWAFVPENQKLPLVLGKQLVWRGDALVELQECLKFKATDDVIRVIDEKARAGGIDSKQDDRRGQEAENKDTLIGSDSEENKL